MLTRSTKEDVKTSAIDEIKNKYIELIKSYIDNNSYISDEKLNVIFNKIRCINYKLNEINNDIDDIQNNILMSSTDKTHSVELSVDETNIINDANYSNKLINILLPVLLYLDINNK